MPTPETSIYIALKNRAFTLPTYPVIEPGAIIPLANAPHILLSDVRNDKERWSIAGDSIQSGTFMLTLMWPLVTPVTHVQLMEAAGLMAAHFPADLCLSFGGISIRVTRDSDALSSYVDGAYRVVPVRVFWSTT